MTTSFKQGHTPPFDREDSGGSGADQHQLLGLYGRMVLVRRVEGALAQAHTRGQIKGPVHLCDGQEAVGIGVTSVLQQGDTIVSTHRGHAHYLGMGIDLNAMIAEIMGKADGLCKGRAGHMLIADAQHGLLGGNGIVGGGLAIATGMALAHRNLKNGSVAVCFFGDGAVNTGAFNEALNMAGLWQLPVVFVAEINQYGLTVALTRHMSNTDVVSRAQGYGLPGVQVDGNDIEVVIDAARTAVDLARSGGGPTLLVAQTYRRLGFSTTDAGGYQPAEEVENWPDPLDIARGRLLERGTKPDVLDAIEENAADQVAAAIAYGLDSPYPDPSEFVARARR